MATPDHTPHGRGYKTSLHYFHHCNDYWTYTDGAPCNSSATGKPEKVVDLWQNNLDGSGEQGPAHGYNNTCQPDTEGTKCTAYGAKTDHVFGGYEDALMAQQVMKTLEDHDAATPYFLFWAPHIVHTPLEVPASFYDKFDFMADTDRPGHERQIYHAMVDFADEAIGNFTGALKSKKMWDDSIIVFSADNGGPVYMNGSAGANNFPLKVRLCVCVDRACVCVCVCVCVCACVCVWCSPLCAALLMDARVERWAIGRGASG